MYVGSYTGNTDLKSAPVNSSRGLIKLHHRNGEGAHNKDSVEIWWDKVACHLSPPSETSYCGKPHASEPPRGERSVGRDVAVR